MVSLFDPNGPINRKYTFLRVILRVQEGPEDAKRTNNRATRGGGRGKGEGKPYPLWACLEVLGFGGFVAWWVPLHASRHKASADFYS